MQRRKADAKNTSVKLMKYKTYLSLLGVSRRPLDLYLGAN